MSDPKLTEVLSDDHATLERGMHELLQRAYANDYAGMRMTFHLLECELEAHLAAEERDMLPRFALACPEEAQGLRHEHALIRSHLDELRLSIERQALRAHEISAFVEQLHEHAEREAKTLYMWADIVLPDRQKWPLLRWLAARLEGRGTRRTKALTQLAATVP
jgi:hypothetical protein